MELRDLRAVPADLTVPEGPYSRPDSVSVVHSVGSDTVIGKKVVTLELDSAARERGLRSVFVPTGQTGVAIAGWGIAVDHVISDYVAGAGERLVHEGAERGDLLFVEGQGALFHPAYSGSDAGAPARLRAGPARAGEQAERHAQPQLPGPADPALNELIQAYEAVAAPVRPATVAAIALNTPTSTRTRPGRRWPRRSARRASWPTTWCASGPGVLEGGARRPRHPGEKPSLIFRHRAVREIPACGDICSVDRAATRSCRTPTARARTGPPPLLPGPGGAVLPLGAGRGPPGADGGNCGAGPQELQSTKESTVNRPLHRCSKRRSHGPQSEVPLAVRA